MNGNITMCNPETKEGEIVKNLNSIDFEIGELLRIKTDLISKLKPVLKNNNSPSPNDDGCDDLTGESDFGLKLKEIKRTLESLKTELKETIDNICL